MTARTPVVLGGDGLPQQLQTADSLSGYYAASEVDAKLAAISGSGGGIPDGIVSGCGIVTRAPASRSICRRDPST
jgi:hypothetical protein